MKFIFISGGVLSGLGKGVTAASIGLLLKLRGFRVTAVKCDMYLNIDAGTMNPIEHGEVFVTHDGVETDQDIGHYERFMNQTLKRSNYITNGLIYQIVLNKERSLAYDGKCVEPYHHIPPEIISHWYQAGRENRAQITIVELGGTVGEYEGLLFFEAIRRLKLKIPDDVLLIHVGYLPVPPSIGELKSKPLQQSISLLNSLGLQPDIIVGRAEKRIDRKRKEKIALASGLKTSDIFSNPDRKIIYEVPLILEKQQIVKKILKKLKIRERKRNEKLFWEWSSFLKKAKSSKEEVKIAVVGKYQKTGDYTLEDSYISVVEALRHAGWYFGVKPYIKWVDSEALEKKKNIDNLFEDVSGIIVPQGWGKRGVEGKIRAVNFARVNKIPYLGLCFGMQMAVIEFARNVCNLKYANTQEANPLTPHPVIHIMPEQKKLLKNQKYGGTIRLGAWPCQVRPKTKLDLAYKKYGKKKESPWFEKNGKINYFKMKKDNWLTVYERHRHRYEFNNKYKDKLTKRGLIISGISPDGKLVEAIEIKDHPFFIGTQFHPEYLSRPLSPHPIFLSFVASCLEIKNKKFSIHE